MNLSSLMSISGPITSSRLAFRRIWDSLHTHNTRITLLEKANLQCYSESTILLISSSLSSLDSDSLTEVDTRHILIGASRVAASCCFIDASPQCFLDIFSRVIAVSHHASSFFKRVMKKMCVINIPLLKLV